MRYEPGGVAKNTADDFWSKVDIRAEDECWPWKEGTWSNGYGRYKQNYQSVRAHRVALVLFKGVPEDGGLLALHSCHNRLCCNPYHLRWGTHKENMLDRAARKLPAWNRNNPPALIKNNP